MLLFTVILGLAGLVTVLAIHLGDWYDDASEADTVAHYAAGLAIGAWLALVGLGPLLGVLVAALIALLWELYEIPSPMAGYLRAGTTDTAVDVVAVIVGAALSLLVHAL